MENEHAHLRQCPECGGLTGNGETCAERFNVLLALDHSRQEPWGSRHGPAFAAYTLQHSTNISSDVLQNCWTMLSRIYEHGDDRMDVVKGIRATYRSTHDTNYSKANRQECDVWNASTFPLRTDAPKHFSVTIADLGEFSADSYAALLDAWCVATLESWKR